MDFEVTIIGAGVIGLSIAKALSKKKINTVVIEKNHNFGEETSSRNSGVIYAGIYYPKFSKKSAFCKQGNKLLYKYLKERKIGFLNCGKLIVASNQQENDLLLKLKKNAQEIGTDLIYLNKKETVKTLNEICEYPEGIDISYNQKLIVVACWFEDNIILLDLNSNELKNIITVSGGPRSFGNFILDDNVR